jgi:hypothetical protein
MDDQVERYVLSFAAAALGLVFSGGVAAQTQPVDDGMSSCIADPNIRRTQIIDDENIVFVMRDKTIQHNTLARRCPGLRRNSKISLTPADRQVCNGTNFQVLVSVSTGSNSTSVTVPGSNERLSVPSPNFIPGPVCTLGPFEEIDEERLDDLVAAAKARSDTGSRRERRAEAERQAVESATAPQAVSSPE